MKKQQKRLSVFTLIALLSQVFVGFAFAQEFPQAPGEVQNVVAVAGDGQVTLSWDEAVDADGVVNEYKVYYGTTAVQTAEDMYEDEVTAGIGLLTHTITGLANGTSYFFAVTAVDDEQMESDTYSVEVSATPAGVVVVESIKVLDVRQNWDNEVQLIMSKDVFFAPGEDPRESFIITGKDSGTQIAINEIQVKDTQLVLITAEDFVAGQAYQIVATAKVEDKDGKSVEAGSMDRVEFVAVRFSEEPVTSTEPDAGTEDPNAGTTVVEPSAGETTEPTVVVESAVSPDTTETVTTVEDVQDFSLDTSLLKSEQLVLLEWSLAETPNIADQILYTRRGLEDWDSGYSIGIDITQLELEVDMDENYEVKVVTVDAEGGESEGTTLSFSTGLSATGPGTIGSVIALILLFMMGLLFFKKQRAY
jgi:hypothetical protein